MEWPIQEIARAAGTTSRTLRYYGEIGLFEPSRVGQNGYRYYDERALLRFAADPAAAETRPWHSGGKERSGRRAGRGGRAWDPPRVARTGTGAPRSVDLDHPYDSSEIEGRLSLPRFR